MLDDNQSVLEDSILTEAELNTPPATPSDLELLTQLNDFLVKEIGLGPNTPYCNKKNALKTILALVALPAGVPFVNLAQRFAKNNLLYGNLLASGTVICYANVCFWAYMGLVDDLLREDKNLANILRKSKFEQGFRLIAPFILSTIAAVPSLYLSYTYNNQHVIWPIINFTSSFGYRAYGFQKGINHVINYLKSFKKNTSTHQDLVELIDLCRVASRSVTTLERLKLEELIVTEENNEVRINIRDLIYRISSDQLIPQRSPRQVTIQKYGQFAACILPVAQISLNGILSWHAYGLIVSNPILKALMIAITVCPDSSLMLMSSMMMAANGIGLIFNRLNHSDEGLNSFYYNKKMAFAFIPLVLLIAAFSYGANAFAIEEHFSAALNVLLLPLFIMADTFFHVYVLAMNTSQLIEDVTRFKAPDEKKNVLRSARLLERFAAVLEQLPEDKSLVLTNSMEVTDPKEKCLRRSRRYHGFFDRNIVDEEVALAPSTLEHPSNA